MQLPFNRRKMPLKDLNSLDDETWNPATASHIAPYDSADRLEENYRGRRISRAGLHRREGLRPRVSHGGRLDTRKDVLLIRDATFSALQRGAQLDSRVSGPQESFNHGCGQCKHPTHDSPECHLEIGYNAKMAHLIHADSDLIAVHSKSEACGLTQMIVTLYPRVREGLTISGAGYRPYHANWHCRALGITSPGTNREPITTESTNTPVTINP